MFAYDTTLGLIIKICHTIILGVSSYPILTIFRNQQMKILVVRSSKIGRKYKDSYLDTFNTSYADKVLTSLTGSPIPCSVCGNNCIGCRVSYPCNFKDSLVGIISFPSVMPHLIEEPAFMIPSQIPPHDILIAIHIHEQLLIEMLLQCKKWGTKAVIIPIESPSWISPAAIDTLDKISINSGFEICFPKPFCSFNPPSESILGEFRRLYHIGYPEIEITLEGNKIRNCFVHVSAPCGSTYFICRWLKGLEISMESAPNLVAKFLHAYPCTADMQWDNELDDTILHKAIHIHQRAVENVLMPTCFIPHSTVLKTQSDYNPVKDLHQAINIIKSKLKTETYIEITHLRKQYGMSPVIINMAIIQLKQNGYIHIHEGVIFSVPQKV